MSNDPYLDGIMNRVENPAITAPQAASFTVQGVWRTDGPSHEYYIGRYRVAFVLEDLDGIWRAFLRGETARDFPTEPEAKAAVEAWAREYLGGVP